MKKSFKKHLMLVLIVVAILTATFSISYAASNGLPDTIVCSNCNSTQKAELGNKIEPQCDAEGYTEIICSNCKTLYGTTATVDKLGHKTESYTYTLEKNGEYFEHIKKCTRELCDYSEVESRLVADDQGEVTAVPVKYCQVNFTNNFVAEVFESNVFCPYAKLAAVDADNAYSTKTETIYVEFPAGKAETPVVASGTPYRMADRYYGRYIFAGWLTQAQIDEAYTASASTSTFGLKYDTHEICNGKNLVINSTTGKKEMSKADKDYYDNLINAAEANVPAVTATTAACYDLYAIFEVDTAVEHTVNFYNYDGTLLYSDKVNHATQSAKFEGDLPEREDNLEYTYDFLYWNLYGTATQMSSYRDIDAVYGDVNVIAHYRNNLRHYKLLFCDLDGKPIIDTFDRVTLAGFGKTNDDIPEVGLEINNNKMVKPFYDERYIYEPTGKWLVPSRGNYVVNLNHVTLPDGTLDENEIEYIVLVPQYQKYVRMYKLAVDIIYDDDTNYHPEEIDLQVTNAEGKVVGFATVDRSEKYYKDKTYRISFDVEYSSQYTIVGTSTGYKGTGGTMFHTMNPTTPDDDGPGQVLVTMKVLEGDPCGCICHTFFKPVWVGILNLLNSLFKLEFVCCEDMFANIGSELNYGP
ncbi:MAG: hypothetical protein J6V06_04965 [Clostridia bacterium]|nr:hypothetical protein [Clostridia bacterium]